ncbi:MAG: chlorite dismutase family protein [Elusimicrobia bacterium]|jgi:chlorite dismutase|nr:chlorite dismutase family protein [Elusimicrobiota bacterium]
MNKLFSIFTFVRLSNRFNHLQQNEKITLKQEFENSIANFQEKIFLRTYFTSGLKEDCDILFWRMHSSLDYLQNICARTFSIGIGKYMDVRYTYIGAKDFQKSMDDINSSFGIYPYLLVHPLNKSHEWYDLSDEDRKKMMKERENVLSKYTKIQENFFISYGIDDQDMIVVREASDINNLISATENLKCLKNKCYTTNDRPVFLSIGKDLREILDNIS